MFSQRRQNRPLAWPENSQGEDPALFALSPESGKDFLEQSGFGINPSLGKVTVPFKSLKDSYNFKSGQLLRGVKFMHDFVAPKRRNIVFFGKTTEWLVVGREDPPPLDRDRENVAIGASWRATSIFNDRVDVLGDEVEKEFFRFFDTSSLFRLQS